MARKKNTLITDFNNIPDEALVPEDEQPYPIPDHWKWMRLGSICELNPRKPGLNDFPADFEVAFLPMTGVSDETGTVSQIQFRKFEEVRKGYTFFSSGDVLFAKITPCMENGKSAIVPSLASEIGFGSTEFFVLRPSEFVDGRYLHYLLRSEGFRQKAKDVMTGAVGQQRVPASFLESFPFPLPPLDEQRAIVDALESHTSKIDQAIAAARSFLNDSEDTRCTLIESYIGNHSPLDNFRNAVWLKKPISTIGEIVTGSTPSTKVPEFYGGDLPFIKPGDLDAGRHVISAASFLSSEGASKARTLPAPVVAVCGIGATIGKCGLIEVPCATNQQIHAIIPNADYDPTFLYYLMSSKRFKNQIIKNSSATTLPIINKTRFSLLVIEIPASKDVQERIVSDLEAKLSQLDKAEGATREALVRLTNLRHRLVSMAMHGKLSIPRECTIA